jgi:hypothetical protein
MDWKRAEHGRSFVSTQLGVAQGEEEALKKNQERRKASKFGLFFVEE